MCFESNHLGNIMCWFQMEQFRKLLQYTNGRVEVEGLYNRRLDRRIISEIKLRLHVEHIYGEA